MIMAGFPTQISVVATALNINLFRLFVTFSIVSKHYCTCIAVQHTHMAQHVTNDAAVDTALLLYRVLSSVVFRGTDADCVRLLGMSNSLLGE